MAANYKQYDPDKVIILVAGHRVRGFGDGKMVTITYANERRAVAPGLDNVNRFVKYLNTSGSIEIPTSDHSDSNQVFDMIDKGDMMVPVVVKDMTSKGTMFATGAAMVQKTPDFARGKDPEEQPWILTFLEGKMLFTGAKEATIVTQIP